MGNKAVVNHPIGQMQFQQLTFVDYMRLDELLGRQYKVLYLQKIKRLQYMVPVNNGVFWKPVDHGNYDMPGSSVKSDLGQGDFLAEAQMYACDKYANLYILRNELRDGNGKLIQLNHSTLAGHDVMSAGTISIKNGTLRGVSNTSGHYKPSTQHLTNFLTMLQNEGGVAMDNSVVVIDEAAGCYTTADQYLNRNYQNLHNTPAMNALLARNA